MKGKTMDATTTKSTLQTLGQYGIKEQMGYFRGCRTALHFNWRFWKPVKCIGGNVYFGMYVEVFPSRYGVH